MNAQSRRLLIAVLSTLTFLATITGLLAPPPNSAAELPTTADIESSTVLVRYRAGADLARAAAELQAVGLTETREIRKIGVHKLRVPAGREREFAERLAARPDVEFAEVSPLAHAFSSPNDPLYPFQWALTTVGAEEAWERTRGNPAIVVAVIDSGFDVGHPDAPANLIPGTDYILPPDGTGKVTHDPVGHGTHVTGAIAARGDNEIGIAGLAPGVTLLNIRVLGSGGFGSYADIADAVIEATDAGARVANLSLGGEFADLTLLSAVQYAASHGTLVVAAAGNCGDPTTYAQNGCSHLNPRFYPAAYPGVFAVAGTTVDDTRASYSNVGSYVSIAAPGGDNPVVGVPSAATRILSLYPRTNTCLTVAYTSPPTTPTPSPTPGSQTQTILVPLARSDVLPGYCTLRGTSMAAPHVSALAGLILSENPNLTVDQVTSIIKATAKRLGTTVPDDQFGYGRIDAAAALSAVPSP
jgi:serine protease